MMSKKKHALVIFLSALGCALLLGALQWSMSGQEKNLRGQSVYSPMYQPLRETSAAILRAPRATERELRARRGLRRPTIR